MKTIILITLALAIAAPAFAYNVNDGVYPEIHCKHFFYAYPTGTPTTNDLIIRDIYALSSNDETKFADWVAYRLDEDTITGPSIDYNYWKTDPWLDDDETLEANPRRIDDYRGAYADLGTDRGHQAPLASFKGTDLWKETYYYSNATPQMEDLNRGPWVKLENRVGDLVYAGNVVYVMTGPLYEYEEGPELPNADEPHRVPSGYWKIVAIQPTSNTNSIRVAAFIFDQDTARDADVIDYLVTIDNVESRTNLKFLQELPDDADEAAIEGGPFATWAAENFG